MLSTISTLLSTLQHFCTVLFPAAGYDTPHNYWASLYMVTLKRAVLSRGGLVCATAVVVRQWTPSVLHGPSDLSATPIIALLHRSNDPSLLLHLHLVTALTLHTSYLPWLLQPQIARLKILHAKFTKFTKFTKYTLFLRAD